jgi:hypothetical protein
MELNKNEELLVDSIAEQCDGPSQVDSGTNIACNVMQGDSAARQKRVMLAALKHCKASKEQMEALSNAAIGAA